MSSLWSVTQAAAHLGVTRGRVRERIRTGSLAAQRVGDRWVIDASDVVLPRPQPGPGRPYSARSSWALIMAAADPPALASLSAPNRSRARTRLRGLLDAVALAHDQGRSDLAIASLVAVALRRRAERQTWRASPLDVEDLLDDARLHRSGVSAAASGISAGQVAEGYVRDGDLAGLVDDYLLSATRRPTADVILHVVEDSLNTSPEVLGLVESPLVLAADLAEHRGPRELALAATIAARLATATARSAHVRGS